MVILQNTTQKKFWIKSLLFVCVTLFLYFLTTSFAHAADGDLGALDKFMLGFSLGVGGFVAGLGGVLFDMAIDNFALQMGHWFINRGVGAVVTSIWTMIRDLFNILFIFSLVYIGLRTIWDADDSRTKKMLGMLIAAALLINFSLYIAKVVVDIANFTTVQIYQTATEGIEGQYGLGITIEDSVTSFLGAESSISGAYMEVLNVSSWFDDNVGTTGNVFVYSIFALFFLMFLGLVLAYGAIMLVARFIAIIFYLMFSPLMFLGWVLPQFQKYATKWWKGFLGYSFFAPVYVFMLYIGLYSLQQIRVGLNISHNNSFSKTFTGETFTIGNFEIFLLFTVGVGFLIAATKVASAMSSGGAAIGMNMADKMGRRVVGRVANTTVGAGANWVGTRMDARSAASGKSRSRTGRAVRSLVDSGTTAKFGAATSRKERVDADKAEKTRHSTAHAVHKFSSALNLDDSTPENIAKKQEAFANMSESQLIEITKSDKGKALVEKNAHMLSTSQMKAIAKSDDVNDKGTSDIGNARTKATIKQVTDGHLEIKDATKDQLGALGVDELIKPDNAFALSEEKIKGLDITDIYKDQIKNARKKVIKDVASGTPGASVGNVTKADLLKAKPGDIAKYPAEALKSMADELSTNTLTKIVVDNTQSTEDQRAIRATIMGFVNAAPALAQSIAYMDFFTNTPAGKSFGN